MSFISPIRTSFEIPIPELKETYWDQKRRRGEDNERILS